VQTQSSSRFRDRRTTSPHACPLDVTWIPSPSSFLSPSTPSTSLPASSASTANPTALPSDSFLQSPPKPSHRKDKRPEGGGLHDKTTRNKEMLQKLWGRRYPGGSTADGRGAAPSCLLRQTIGTTAREARRVMNLAVVCGGGLEVGQCGRHQG